MDAKTVSRLALILAAEAEVQGMLVDNIVRSSYDESPMWSGDHFAAKASELRDLASEGAT